MSRSVARPKECSCRVNRKRRERENLSARTEMPQGAQVLDQPHCNWLSEPLWRSASVIGQSFVVEHACALARSENSVALVFAVKRGLVSRERLHDWIRDVVSAFVTVGIAAANHEQCGRVLDHDPTHVLRLREAAFGAVFDRQRKAYEIGDRGRKSGGLVLPQSSFGKSLRSRAVPSKTIHSMFRPSEPSLSRDHSHCPGPRTFGPRTEVAQLQRSASSFTLPISASSATAASSTSDGFASRRDRYCT